MMGSYLTNPTCWTFFLATLLGTLVLTPLVIRLAIRIGAVDHGGYRKIHGHQIPRMGGLAVALPLLAICLLGLLQPTSLSNELKAHHRDLLLLATGGIMIAALGVVDDLRRLRPRDKLAVQLVVALLVWLGGRSLTLVWLPLVGVVNLGAIGGMVVTVLWVVGMINAFNLVDGVDGLASGLALVSAVGLGIVAALNGQGMVVLICLSLVGSLAAFLVFNFHPARIFLGDTGSLFLGFILATLALMGASRTSGSVMLLAPALALGFPIFDTLTSLVRRLLRGRNPFVGDCAHTHHRLLDYGYSQRQVVLILYAVALMCTISAVLCQIYYPRDRVPLIAVGIYATVIMAIAWANGYLRLRHALRLCRCRARNAKLENFSRFATFSLTRDPALDNLRAIMRVGCRELRLRFLEIGRVECPDQADGAASRVLLIESATDAAPRPYAMDSLVTLRLLDAANQHLLVRFEIDYQAQHYRPADEETRLAEQLEYEDVTACLAHLFGNIRLPAPAGVQAVAELPRMRGITVAHELGGLNGKD